MMLGASRIALATVFLALAWLSSGCGGDERGDETPSPIPSPTQVQSPSPAPPTPSPTTAPDPTPTPFPSPTPTATPTATPDPDSKDEDADGYSPNEGDCDDSDPELHPDATEIPYDSEDQDCDGQDLNDQDGDGSIAMEAFGEDCDDLNSLIYPSAEEVDNDMDDDCDGEIDEGLPTTDDDGDGYSEVDLDCDDQDPLTYPEAEELPYDGEDQDCDGADLSDVDKDGYDALDVEGGSDCEDSDDQIHPGSPEVPYDAVDQDCDGKDLTDVDGDGFSSSQVQGGSDCDDQDLLSYPGAEEQDDNQDNDCDGQVDEGLQTTDDDGDGFTEIQGDCDDTDLNVYPGASEVPYDGIDQDCTAGDLDDLDLDGYSGGSMGTDCDDDDPYISPGAAEIAYDGIDQDCSGEDLVDVDGDGATSSSVPGGTDCDDGDASIHPAREDFPYDGIDQDCSGSDLRDIDLDGHDSVAVGGDDCNDFSATIHPEVQEICDGIDNNCDGVVDVDAMDRQTYYQDLDSDGYGDLNQSELVCSSTPGYVSDSTDCNDARIDIHPGAAEVCDEADNDCDGITDEGVQTTYYSDADQDGHGDPATSVLACAAPSGFVADASDCDDTRRTVYPGGTELCNDLDDNCNGAVDESSIITLYPDEDGDSYGNPEGAISLPSCDAPPGYVADSLDCDDTNAAAHPGGERTCDGADNDCDGVMDVLYFSSNFQEINNASVFRLNGSASQGWFGSDGYLLMTENLTFQTGTAFLTSKVDGNSFYAAFTARMEGGYRGGADGLTMVFLDESSPTIIGITGSQLGAGGLKGYAVELDTWYNAEYSDPNDNHIGLVKADTWQHLATNPALPNLESGASLFVEIFFLNGQVRALLNGVEVLNTQIPGYALSKVLLGFTAATGGASNLHSIDNVTLGCW